MPFLKIDPPALDALDQSLPRADFNVYFYLSERTDRAGRFEPSRVIAVISYRLTAVGMGDAGS